MLALGKSRFLLVLACLPVLLSQTAKRALKLEDLHAFHDVRDLQIFA